MYPHQMCVALAAALLDVENRWQDVQDRCDQVQAIFAGAEAEAAEEEVPPVGRDHAEAPEQAVAVDPEILRKFAWFIRTSSILTRRCLSRCSGMPEQVKQPLLL